LKKSVVLFAVLCVCGVRAQQLQPEPKADPRAVVTVGHARFTVLTPKLIRMEWSADGVFEDRASFVFLNRLMPVPKFTQSKGQSDEVTIATDALKLVYRPALADGGRFRARSLSVSFMLNGKPVTWTPGMADTGNLQGTTRTLDGARGNKTREPIGPGLVSRDGWTVVDDSARPLFDSTDFSFSRGEASVWPWVTLRSPGEREDLYFFGYGHAYKEALGDYVRVAGRIPLPPRFAFGTWWSRYWAYSDQELEDLVKGFRENSVPLDVLVIDMDWHQTFGVHAPRPPEKNIDQAGELLGWTGYTWDKHLFPDPGLFLQHIHQEGLKATLNLHPASGVQPWEDAYPAMATAMGIDPASKKYVPFDITDKKFATNYMDLLHHPLEKQGIDFWWLDWQQKPTTALPGVSPTWWLNYVHFTDQEREGKRPLLFHRWGGLGNHRYEIGFSGDTVSVWDSLAFQPWFTATAANVGYAYWSHDIGGHQPGPVDPELFTRWVQFGAFSPILRTHTSKNPDSERRIWAYPEPYSDMMRQTFQTRYAMQPYIYTEARRTYDTGVAFVRPLYYEWPDAADAYDSRNEYMFGDQMMVAPVTVPVDAESQLATVSLWVPPGDWFEWSTGKHLHGPAKIEGPYSIDQVPEFVRAGAIVPMQPAMEYTGEKPIDPLIVNVMPLADGQHSAYTLYDDSTQGESYEDGVCTWTELKAERTGDDVHVVVEVVRGSFAGMIERRGYEIRLPGDWPPERVTANGAEIAYEPTAGKIGWRFDGNTLTTIVTLPQSSVHDRVELTVHRRAGLAAKAAELNGFAGAMARYRAAYDALNHAGEDAWSPDALIEAWQTGDRMSYQPQTAEAEMDAFAARSKAAMQAVAALVAAEPGIRVSATSEAERHRMMLHRAAAALRDLAPQ
jgi:alpha-glucosidase (family GH31 glycosyl hydrolase)